MPCRIHLEQQLVAARDAARWVNHDGMAHLLAFGVKRLLHHERPFGRPRCKHGSLLVTLEAERELGPPRAQARSGS
jgi:hypothetical protein